MAEEKPEPRRAPPSINNLIPRLSREDDIEAYLVAFERTARREGWPGDEWVGLIAPLLTGPAQAAYYDLCEDADLHYPHLKTEILARYNLTPWARAQRFHAWTYTEGESPRGQLYQLTRLVKGWLVPAQSVAAVLETVAIDKCLRELPTSLLRTVSQSNPQSMDDLVKVIDSCGATEALVKAGRRERPATVPPVRRNKREGRPTADREKTGTAPTPRPLQCFRCQAYGHMARNCPMIDEPMPTEARTSSPPPPQARTPQVQGTCWHTELAPARKTPVKIGGLETYAFLDSGSMVSLIQKTMTQDGAAVEGEVAVSCIHGDTQIYPRGKVRLITPVGRISMHMGFSTNLTVPVLLGRDCPIFDKLWANAEKHEKENKKKQSNRLHMGLAHSPTKQHNPSKKKRNKTNRTLCGFLRGKRGRGNG